jgi:hypothetical protein
MLGARSMHSRFYRVAWTVQSDLSRAYRLGFTPESPGLSPFRAHDVGDCFEKARFHRKSGGVVALGGRQLYTPAERQIGSNTLHNVFNTYSPKTNFTTISTTARVPFDLDNIWESKDCDFNRWVDVLREIPGGPSCSSRNSGWPEFLAVLKPTRSQNVLKYSLTPTNKITRISLIDKAAHNVF